MPQWTFACEAAHFIDYPEADVVAAFMTMVLAVVENSHDRLRSMCQAAASARQRHDEYMEMRARQSLCLQFVRRVSAVFETIANIPDAVLSDQGQWDRLSTMSYKTCACTSFSFRAALCGPHQS